MVKSWSRTGSINWNFCPYQGFYKKVTTSLMSLVWYSSVGIVSSRAVWKGEDGSRRLYSWFAHEFIKIQKSRIIHPTKLFLTWYVDTSVTIFQKMFQVLTMFCFPILNNLNV